jgi:hypothetical protein
MTNEITEAQLKNLCADIKKRTDLNDHTGAIKIVCGLLGYEDLHAILCTIEKLHNKAGFISDELLHVRQNIYEIMIKNIYSDYCTYVYEEIKKSF